MSVAIKQRYASSGVQTRKSHDARFRADLEQRYDYMARECHYRGADFVLFWQPTRWTESAAPVEADAFTTFRANIQLVYSRLEARLSAKPYFVSLRGVLLGQDGVYAPDGVHLTDKGRHIVARAMAAQLLTRPGAFENRP